MKIYSKYRDYYDLGLTYGLDPYLHYVRKELTFYAKELRNRLPEHVVDRISWGERFFKGKYLVRFVVGFCGTLYPGIEVRTDKSKEEYDSEFVYTQERLREIFPLSKAQEKEDRKYRWLRSITTVEDNCKFLEQKSGFDKLFIELSTMYRGDYVAAPVFVIDSSEKITVNAQLSKYEFAKVKDPFTAFQEISMYLGNQLTHVEEPIQISDKDMLVEKGFDIKTSFRHPVKFSQL